MLSRRTPTHSSGPYPTTTASWLPMLLIVAIVGGAVGNVGGAAAQASTPAAAAVCQQLASLGVSITPGLPSGVPAATAQLGAPLYYRMKTYQQTFNYTCGPSSLVAALEAFGLVPPEALTSNALEIAIANAAGTNWIIGTSDTGMIAGATFANLTARMQSRMSFADVHAALSNGELVIVCYEVCRDNSTIPWPLSYDNGHYSVIFGIDAANVYLMDPWVGQLGFVPRAQWLMQWHSTFPYGFEVRWGMMVKPMVPVSSSSSSSSTTTTTTGGSALPAVKVLQSIPFEALPPNMAVVDTCNGDI